MIQVATKSQVTSLPIALLMDKGARSEAAGHSLTSERSSCRMCGTSHFSKTGLPSGPRVGGVDSASNTRSCTRSSTSLAMLSMPCSATSSLSYVNKYTLSA